MAQTRSPEAAGERSQFARDFAPFDFRPLAGVVAPLAGTEPAVRGSPVEPVALGSTARGWAVALAVALVRTQGFLRPSPPPRGAILRTLARAVATEVDRGVAFLLVPVLLAAGALVYFSIAAEPGWLPLATGLLCLLACAFASRARPVLNMAFVAALLCVGGALLAKAETWRAGTSVIGGEITTRLSGRVVEVERMANGRIRLTIAVTATERPVLRYAPDRVRVSARRIPEGVVPGAAITGLVSLMPPSGPVRPASYDFSFESYFDGIGASGFFLRGPELEAGAGPQTPLAVFRAAVERARISIADRISKGIGGAEGEIAAALVVGVRAGIPEDVNEALRRAGIYHIISISGLHMALVAGTIMGLLRAGFALFPEFSSLRPVKKYAAALALVGLAGYLFMSGGEVAAQRSFIMIAVMLVAVLFDRAALTMRNLAIAAVIVIAVSPHEVVGPSFQMSFAATAALVGGYAAWSDWRGERVRQPVTSPSLAGRLFRMAAFAIAGLAFTSIVAGGATAIYAAWHFQQMPTLGLFTNLAAMPIVSTMVMPFAVIGALAMPFGLDGPFFQVMGLGLSATIAVARWFAERTPAGSTGLIPAATVAVLTVALLVATIATTWLRIVAVPIALVGLALLAGRPEPDLFVSEDGALVGLRIGGGGIAVNRSRPNAFSIENWQRAMRASEIIGPQGKEERAAGGSEPGAPIAVAAPPVARTVPDSVVEAAPRVPPTGFVCSEGLCIGRHPSGAVVAHALDARAAMDACAIADVVVIDDATVKDPCRWKDIMVITSRDLALGGSATVTFPGAGTVPHPASPADAAGGAHATVQYAIAQPYRPWHEQRRFSRAARGLPPYQRTAAVQSSADTAPTSSRRSKPAPPMDQAAPEPVQ